VAIGGAVEIGVAVVCDIGGKGVDWREFVAVADVEKTLV